MAHRYTGMRRSEALALKRNDVHTKTIQVSTRRVISAEDWTQTKIGNARVIDVDAKPLEMLTSYQAAHTELAFSPAKADAFVFEDDDGHLRSPDAMTGRWDRRLEVGDGRLDTLTGVTLKGLRHTHATLLLELGEHPKGVQERVGHSTITMTINIYSHVTPTMQRSAFDRFATHLGVLSTANQRRTASPIQPSCYPGGSTT